MATSEGSPVHFFDICENSLYFQVECETGTDEVDQDVFNMCAPNSESYWLRSTDQKFLLLNENELNAEDLNNSQQSQPGCKFRIQTYNEIPNRRYGRAAILYVQMKDSDIMVVYCDEQHNIGAKKMALPTHINDITNEAVFYMIRQTSSNTVRFQPSMHPTKFLGFAHVKDPCVKKLILCPGDELDGTCDILRERVSS